MSYVSGSGDFTGKQIPKALPANATSKAIAPAAEAVVAQASYVIINAGHATKYEFLYESGGSYVDYGIIAADGPIRIDIHPIAWKGGAGTTGHVTFVYQGGLF